MKCDDVQTLLIDGRGDGDRAGRRAAMEHLASCERCRDAQYAAGVLRVERSRAVPGPTPGAFERAMAAAVGASRQPPSREALPPARAPRGRGFWAGAAVGAGSAAAAALAAWAVIVGPAPGLPGAQPSATPEVAIALHETRDVNISVDTPAALTNAEIRVVLTGDISLDGFAQQRELRWYADLDAGSNRLSLPIVATGATGGQLLVEVQHERKRRTFVVDVRGVEA